MDRSEELKKSVSIISAHQYQEMMNQRGLIKNHRWDLMANQRMHILKVALDAKTGMPIPDKLPSWVFVEELLGIRLTINELGIVGDFEYDTDKNVLDNIKEILPQVSKEQLSKSIYLKEEDLDNPLEAIEKNYALWKENFILKRTTMKIINYTEIQSKFGKFKQGILDKTLSDEEAQKVTSKLRDYYYLIKAIVDAQFNLASPNAKNQDVKIYASQVSKYEFNNSPMNSKSKPKAIVFVVYSNLVEIQNPNTRQMMKVESKKEGTEINELASFNMNSNKFGKINAVEAKIKEQDFDTISIELLYNSQNSKLEAGGTNLEISESEVKLREEEVFELFKGAIPDISYAKCYGMSIYDFSEFEEQAMTWLVNNKEMIEKIPGETREKLNEDMINMVYAEAQAAKDAEDVISNFNFSTQEEESESQIGSEASKLIEEAEETVDAVEETTKDEEVVTPKEAEEHKESLEAEYERKAKELNLTVEQYKSLVEKNLL